MELSKYRRWFIYLICCALFVFSQFYRSSIAVISPNLVEDLHLDTKSLGIISAAFFYAFALMQIPVGLYLDSVGPRALMTVLSLVAAGGAAAFACSESMAGLVVARVFLGVGMACNLMGPLKLMTSWFSARRFATLAAIFFSIGTAGNIAATTPLVWLTTLLGWRITFLFFAAINLLLVIMFFVVVRDQPQPAVENPFPPAALVDHRQAFRPLWHLLAHKDYWLISLGTFCRYGIYAAIQALWAGPYLMSAIGISQMTTGNLLLTMSIGLVVGSPVCGWMSDTMFRTRKHLIMTGLAAMGALLVLLAVISGSTWRPIFFAVFFCFGFASGAGQVMYAHIKDLMPLKSAGAAMAGINFFTIMGVAFFLHGVGSGLKWFYPTTPVPPDGFRIAFLIFGVCLAFTAIMYSRTGEADVAGPEGGK